MCSRCEMELERADEIAQGVCPLPIAVQGRTRSTDARRIQDLLKLAEDAEAQGNASTACRCIATASGLLEQWHARMREAAYIASLPPPLEAAPWPPRRP